jgi:hypothetical protein
VRSYFSLDTVHLGTNSGLYAIGYSNGVVAIVKNRDSFRDIGDDDAMVASRSVAEVLHRTNGTLGIDGFSVGLLAGVVAAHWVFVLGCIVAAIFPWLVGNGPRFSLRVFLIITTIAALATAIIVAAYRVFSFRSP